MYEVDPTIFFMIHVCICILWDSDNAHKLGASNYNKLIAKYPNRVFSRESNKIERILG